LQRRQGVANTLAQFKSAGLRDLADSTPYFHDGSKTSLNDVVNFYILVSQLGRQAQLRNPLPEFQSMSLSHNDVAALVAFLQSLTEDHNDT
jgi:cytochrome c peroxidase